MRFFRASLLLLLATPACGGNVVVDTSATATGTGGLSTTTGVGASTTGTSTITGSTGTSSTGSSGTTSGGGGCPSNPPNDGDPCSTPGLTCLMPLLCCSPAVQCAGGTWHVGPATCGTPCIACQKDGPGCSPGAVCVEEPSVGPPPPGGPRLDCRANPCSPATLSCTCADSLCGGAGCDAVMGQWVICTQGP